MDISSVNSLIDSIRNRLTDSSLSDQQTAYEAKERKVQQKSNRLRYKYGQISEEIKLVKTLQTLRETYKEYDSINSASSTSESNSCEAFLMEEMKKEIEEKYGEIKKIESNLDEEREKKFHLDSYFTLKDIYKGTCEILNYFNFIMNKFYMRDHYKNVKDKHKILMYNTELELSALELNEIATTEVSTVEKFLQTSQTQIIADIENYEKQKNELQELLNNFRKKEMNIQECEEEEVGQKISKVDFDKIQKHKEIKSSMDKIIYLHENKEELQMNLKELIKNITYNALNPLLPVQIKSSITKVVSSYHLLVPEKNLDTIIKELTELRKKMYSTSKTQTNTVKHNQLGQCIFKNLEVSLRKQIEAKLFKVKTNCNTLLQICDEDCKQFSVNEIVESNTQVLQTSFMGIDFCSSKVLLSDYKELDDKVFGQIAVFFETVKCTEKHSKKLLTIFEKLQDLLVKRHEQEQKWKEDKKHAELNELCQSFIEYQNLHKNKNVMFGELADLTEKILLREVNRMGTFSRADEDGWSGRILKTKQTFETYEILGLEGTQGGDSGHFELEVLASDGPGDVRVEQVPGRGGQHAPTLRGVYFRGGKPSLLDEHQIIPDNYFFLLDIFESLEEIPSDSIFATILLLFYRCNWIHGPYRTGKSRAPSGSQAKQSSSNILSDMKEKFKNYERKLKQELVKFYSLFE